MTRKARLSPEEIRKLIDSEPPESVRQVPRGYAYQGEYCAVIPGTERGNCFDPPVVTVRLLEREGFLSVRVDDLYGMPGG